MSRLAFIRMCALSAILAGALRAIASFIPEASSRIYLLYFAIDVFLLLGISGVVRVFVTGDKIVGRLGVAIMFLALLVLIARDVGVVPAAAYAGTAGVFSLGLDLLAIQLLHTRQMPSWIPVGWILSTIFGSVGFFVPRLYFLFAFSGLLFGIAFVGAGVAMWNLISNAGTNSSRRL